MVVLAGAITAGLSIAHGPEAGLLAGAWILALAAVVHFGRDRSDALRIMSRVGNRRTRMLSTQAVAFAGTVLAFLLPAWWLATLLEGDQNEPLAIAAAIFGGLFITAALYLSRRHG
jgi:hypothetical protein